MKTVLTKIGNKDTKDQWLKMKVEDADRIYNQMVIIIDFLDQDEQTTIEWNSDLENSIECVLEDFETSWRKL